MFPGDLVVGDGDGVIIIPIHLVEEIAEECLAMEKYEAFVLEKVHKGESIIGLYPLTDAAIKQQYEAWLEKR